MNEVSFDHISFESGESEDPQFKEINEEKIAPWLKKITTTITNPNIKFHNEILDFYEFIKPKDEDHFVRMAAYKRVKDIFEFNLPDCALIPFGSFTTKLYLPNSDIDLVLMSNTHLKQALMNKARKVVMRHPDIFTNVEILRNARVPLIKFTEVQSSIEFDITFNEEGGLININAMKEAMVVHPEMKFLMFIFKFVLRQRRMNNSFTGGIGSFLLFCMILAFLRHFKKRKIEEKGIRGLENVSLAEFLLKFMQFYGSEFDYVRKEITMTHGGQIWDKYKPNYSFTLISPQNPDHDIGSQAFKFKEVFSVFKNRFNFMTNIEFPQEKSILKHLINPSGKDFREYIN
jgi:non-canonical poly(A) RNA polymerase PAPD5/7